MALSDPTEIITTEFNDTSYTAGQGPWNKNLDQFSFDSQDTTTNNYISDWTKWHGIYRSIPEARSTIDVECFWIVGLLKLIGILFRSLILVFLLLKFYCSFLLLFFLNINNRKNR